MSDALILALRFMTACSSFVMILSPSRAIIRIYKTKETGYTSIISLVMTLANSHMWTLYGYLLGNIFPIVVVFGSGIFISYVYIAIYYRFTTERTYVIKVTAFVLAFLSVMTAYTVLGATGVTKQSRKEVISVVGYISMGVNILLYTSPFEKIVQVLKLKSAIFIPIDMVVAGSINNILWIVYTALDNNMYMLVPDSVNLGLGIAQLTVYFIYHPKRCPLPKDERYDNEEGITIVLSPRETAAESDKHRLDISVFEALNSPLAPLQKA